MLTGKEFAKLFSENEELDEKMFSTGNEELDELLEKVYSAGIEDGYEYAQKDFGITNAMRQDALIKMAKQNGTYAPGFGISTLRRLNNPATLKDTSVANKGLQNKISSRMVNRSDSWSGAHGTTLGNANAHKNDYWRITNSEGKKIY